MKQVTKRNTSGQGDGSLRTMIRELVDGGNSRRSMLFSLGVQFLIMVSMVAYATETLPDLAAPVRTALFAVEVVTVVLFTIEYALRLVAAESRMRFVFSFFGLIDLLAILPFYLSLGIDLRTLRSFRLLRLFRILKLGRYSAAVRRFHNAILIAKEEIILYLSATGIVVFLAATGIYHFEHEAQPEKFASVFHSLWWAVVTLTTVGYGDVFPVTVGGRCFTFVVLLAGLGVVSVPAGLISSALAKARQIEGDDNRPLPSETIGVDEEAEGS